MGMHNFRTSFLSCVQGLGSTTDMYATSNNSMVMLSTYVYVLLSDSLDDLTSQI